MGTIKGRIIFPVDMPSAGCKVYVRLLDTSMADAPAKTVSETILAFSPEALSGSGELQFELDNKSGTNPSADFSVSVHADVDDDGQLSKDDWMHDHSYPVRCGDAKEVVIKLKKIS